MTTRLIELQKEAREKFKVCIAEGDGNWGEYVNIITNYIYTQAIQDAREALPKEKTMDAALETGSDAGAGYTIGHNYCVREADTAISNLLPK